MFLIDVYASVRKKIKLTKCRNNFGSRPNGNTLGDLVAYPRARYVIEPNGAALVFGQFEAKTYAKRGKVMARNYDEPERRKFFRVSTLPIGTSMVL